MFEREASYVPRVCFEQLRLESQSAWWHVPAFWLGCHGFEYAALYEHCPRTTCKAIFTHRRVPGGCQFARRYSKPRGFSDRLPVKKFDRVRECHDWFFCF